MAYNRKTDSQIVRGDSLDAFVSNMSRTFSDQVTARNAAEELAFNKAVLENNLSLNDQLEYRKEQLKSVSDDPTERTRLKGEIANLKDRVEQKTFTDAYLQKLTEQAAGRASIDSVIQWLTDTKTATTDPSIKESIDKEIRTQTQNQFNTTKNIIMDQTNYALNDKTAVVIGAQLDKVNSQYVINFMEDQFMVIDSKDKIHDLIIIMSSYDIEECKCSFFEIEQNSSKYIYGHYDKSYGLIYENNKANHLLYQKYYHSRFHIGVNFFTSTSFAKSFWKRKFDSNTPHKWEISKHDASFIHNVLIPNIEIQCAIDDEHGEKGTCLLERKEDKFWNIYSAL